MKFNSPRLIAAFLALVTIVLFPLGSLAQSASITTQPQSQSVLIASNATFTVVASGQTPLSCQWSFNGTNLTNSVHISGATNSTLIVSNVVAGDAGNYRVIVTNRRGSATSSNAMLTVLVPATIINQPTNQSGLLTSNATFTVMAAGTGPLSYKWYFNGTLLADGGRISGSTTTNLSIANVQTNDGGFYQVVVTNNYGSATSAIATLTVLVPATITTQPTNQVALLGSTAVFTVAGAGTTPLFYQWQKDGTNLVNGGRVSGTTNPALTISNIQMSDVGSYRVVLTNAYGAVTSADASLLVVPVVAWGDVAAIPLTLTNVVAIATGASHSLALRSDGTVVGWGFNGDGQISVPAGLTNVAAIAAGAFHSLALRSDGTVVGWGASGNDQANPPAGLSNVVAIAGGNSHSLALRSDGTVVGWGSNTYGQTNSPAGLSNVVSIAAGVYHSLALKNDGTVIAWGTSAYGFQVIPPPGLTNVIAIAAGDYHSLALKSDGTVIGWGYNAYGQASSLAGAGFNFTAIAAGGYHSVALRKNGTVFGWGYNYTPWDTYIGQATPPAGLSNVVAVSAGEYSSVALVENPAVQIPPGIWWQPSNRKLPTGQTTIFNPPVTGSLPLRFQWYFNSLPLAGETNNWLALTSIQTNQAGNYQLVVTNNYGSVTSRIAVVTESPGMVTQPANESALLGGSVNFTATVAGIGPLGYQWYFNGVPLTDSARISGSATTVLSISNFQLSDIGSYTLVVTNDIGSITSTAASLMVAGPRYVDLNNTNPLFPFLDWSTAATNIQDAVNVAVNGDQILVTNGVYNSGGAVVYGQETNRVALTKAVTLLSVNGPEATMIVGGTQTRCVYVGSNAALSGFTITNGHAGTSGDLIKERCGGGIWCEASGIVTNCLIRSNSAWDTSYDGAGGGGVYGGTLYNCTIDGNLGYLGGGVRSSTLWNCTLNANKNNDSSSSFAGGGGAYLSALFNCTISSNSTSPSSYGHGAGAYQCVLSNCIVRGNIAFYSASGGGTCQGTNYSCILSNNTVAGGTGAGGGSYQSTNYYCILTGNTASSGGGSCDGRNYNCLITRNSASSYYGGGVCRGTHFNCTIVNNSATNVSGAGGGAYQSTLYNSIVYFNFATSGSNWSSSSFSYCCTAPFGSITSDPLFVNQAGGNFRLQTNSPCINAGNNFYVTNSTDLDGRPRIVGGRVDIGAYEFQGAGMSELIGWLQQYSLPTDGSADYVDTDGDGMNNRQEWKTGTNPTNAASFLQMLSTSNNISGTTVTWQSVSGITYFLQSSTNLGGQPAFSTLQSNIVGQAGTTSYTDTSATNGGPYFYRVGVQ